MWEVLILYTEEKEEDDEEKKKTNNDDGCLRKIVETYKKSQGQNCIDIRRAYAGAREESYFFHKINDRYTKSEATFFFYYSFSWRRYLSRKNNLSFLFIIDQDVGGKKKRISS